MTEAAYIDATNLAKIRIAIDILKSLNLDAIEDRDVRGIVSRLANMEASMAVRAGHVI